MVTRLRQWWRERHLAQLHAAHHPSLTAWTAFRAAQVIPPPKKPIPFLNLRVVRDARRKVNAA